MTQIIEIKTMRQSVKKQLEQAKQELEKEYCPNCEDVVDKKDFNYNREACNYCVAVWEGEKND
jgi:hypothetical protein